MKAQCHWMPLGSFGVPAASGGGPATTPFEISLDIANVGGRMTVRLVNIGSAWKK